MNCDDHSIEVFSDDADTLSFVGDDRTGTIKLYLFNEEEGVPVAKVAEMSPTTLDAMMEQAAAAKHSAEGSDE